MQSFSNEVSQSRAQVKGVRVKGVRVKVKGVSPGKRRFEVFAALLSIAAGTLEFFQVGKILGPASGFLGCNERIFREIRNRNPFDVHEIPCRPALGEYQPGNRGKEVELARRHADGELQALLGEIGLGDFDQGDAEVPEGRGDFDRILRRWLDPEIEVLGETGLGVVGHRVAAHDEVTDLMSAEQT